MNQIYDLVEKGNALINIFVFLSFILIEILTIRFCRYSIVPKHIVLLSINFYFYFFLQESIFGTHIYNSLIINALYIRGGQMILISKQTINNKQKRAAH